MYHRSHIHFQLIFGPFYLEPLTVFITHAVFIPACIVHAVGQGPTGLFSVLAITPYRQSSRRTLDVRHRYDQTLGGPLGLTAGLAD